MRQRNKPWAHAFLESTPQVYVNQKEPFTKIPVKTPAALEIGTGKGDFIMGMALMHPEINYVGIDGQTTVLATAAKKLELNVNHNISLVLMMAQHLPDVFEPELFETIYLNFSDPWPKVRHEKRRLTSPRCLAKIDTVLKPGGCLIFKTDNHALFTYSVASIKEFGYNLEVVDENYAFDFDNDAMSEYEKRFRQAGNTIYRLVARKGVEHK